MDYAAAMKTILVAALSATLFTTTACGKKTEGDKAKPTEGGGKSGGGAAAPAVKLEWKKVGGLGVEMEVPADANIDDNTAGAGAPAATIWASPTTFLSGDSGPDDLDMIKDTMDETKADIQKEAGTEFKGFTKEEKLEGGWHLEWDANSITGNTVFGVSLRLTVDGRPWDCGTNAGSKEEREKVVKMCKSLRKAS